MKNFKLIKEAWDRFMKEELDPSFMSIGAEIKGKIEEINQQVDELISGGAIFFDTETTGLDPVKPQYGATPSLQESKPSTMTEAPKKPNPIPAPFGLTLKTKDIEGQMLTEIAAAYATRDQIISGEFPSEISHTRIEMPSENKEALSSFARKYYKEGTIEFDPDKYFEAIKNKIAYAIKSNELYDKAKNLEPEIFDKVSDEQFRQGVRNRETLEYYGVLEPTPGQIKQFYEEKILPQLSSIKTPHQLLMMTAYFGSEDEVFAKIESGEATLDDLYDLNTEKLEQPKDTKAISEEEAISEFYDFANSKKGIPLIAQNAGFDKKFISARANIHGLPDFDSLGFKTKDTLNLFKLFRNYLEELITKAQEGKEQITAEITKLSGGSEPSKTLATLRTAKGSPTVSQGPMASALRVEATRWHTAIADIEMLFNIFSKVISILKKIAELDQGAYVSHLAPRRKPMKEFKGDSTSFEVELDTSTEEKAASLTNYFNDVIDLSNQAIEMIDIFELAIEKGGTQMNPSKMNKSKVGKMNESRSRITIKLRS